MPVAFSMRPGARAVVAERSAATLALHVRSTTGRSEKQWSTTELTAARRRNPCRRRVRTILAKGLTMSRFTQFCLAAAVTMLLAARIGDVSQLVSSMIGIFNIFCACPFYPWGSRPFYTAGLLSSD